MLRPATPLTILFFVAFVLLVLATISTPIVKGIHLASWKNVNFGVFGYCTPTSCSKIGIGYSIDSSALSSENADFSLSPNTRSSLSSILIVHPVAALLTLICFILSAVAHLHSPSHSPRYLLAVLILSIPTLLITLLAFLVDILLFVPHLAWGGWIVLVSTILILASGIVTCAMRRTLVSRKARKKRIAENAEMSGENFYARQVQPSGLRAETPPPLSDNSLGQSDKLPQFASFETNRSPEDDRMPLNRRTPSEKTVPSAPSSRAPGYAEIGYYERYDSPSRGGRGGIRGGAMRGGPPNRVYGGTPRDEHGHPLPSSNNYGPMPPSGMRRDRSEPPRLRPQYSDEAMYSNGARGRGRGGYPPRGYGRGGNYGPPRGGYGRGGGPWSGPGGTDMRRGPPPPGYGNGYPPPGRPGQYDGPGGPAGYARSPSAPAYGPRGPPSPLGPSGYVQGPSPIPPLTTEGYQTGPSPGPLSNSRDYERRPTPPSPMDPEGYGYAVQEPAKSQHPQAYRDADQAPSQPGGAYSEQPIIGQAVEMDAISGCPSPVPAAGNQMQLRDSDSDVQGFVGLQQQQKHRDSPMSLTSIYSAQDAYVPPRSNWTGNTNARGTTPSPNNPTPANGTNDPIELPTHTTLRKGQPGSNLAKPSHTRKASDNYYEDVDPRFANDSTLQDDPMGSHREHMPTINAVPTSLTPGLSSSRPNHPTIRHHNGHLDVSDAYEELPDGQRSPASDHSNMTSISQRGVNPNWRPGSTDDPTRPNPSRRRPVPEQRGFVVGPNADFEHPVRAGPGSGAPHVGPTQMGQAF